MVEEGKTPAPVPSEDATPPVEEQAAEQATEQAAEQATEQVAEQAVQQQIRLRVDERDMCTSYANFHLMRATADEIMLDLGLNLTSPGSAEQGQPEMVFKTDNRVIMNYYTAKRLAIALGQLIQRYEDQFGVLEVDASKRQKGAQ